MTYPGLLTIPARARGAKYHLNPRQRIILYGRGTRQPLNLFRFLCPASRSRSCGDSIHLRPTRPEDINRGVTRRSITALTCESILGPLPTDSRHRVTGINLRTPSSVFCALETAFTCAPEIRRSFRPSTFNASHYDWHRSRPAYGVTGPHVAGPAGRDSQVPHLAGGPARPPHAPGPHRRRGPRAGPRHQGRGCLHPHGLRRPLRRGARKLTPRAGGRVPGLRGQPLHGFRGGESPCALADGPAVPGRGPQPLRGGPPRPQPRPACRPPCGGGLTHLRRAQGRTPRGGPGAHGGR